MQEAVQLAELAFQGGFDLSRPALHPALLGKLGPGSRNQVIDADGVARPWKGLSTKGASTGSRVMFQVGNTWGGLKDTGGGATQGAGSFYEYVGRSRLYIGAGQVSVEGVDIAGAIASSTLKILLARGGSYVAADSGPYSAGLAQPSAPDVAVVTTMGGGVTGLVENPVSFKIARLRSSTGARSVASSTSVVINPQKKSIRITFPAAATGQDKWAVFSSQQGFGGVGLHYRLPYNGVLDISETVVAAGTVDGVARTLEFDYKDSDLVAELAYIDDYPPPAGTHSFAVDNVVCIAGCYSDATNSPSSTSTGTAIAVSLPNFPESYKPSHLLYLPEQIVSVLQRPSDNFVFIGCRNSMHAVQYVGFRDGPACTITTISPDVGISAAHNWCQVSGRIFACVGKGTLVRLTETGQWDYEWARPVRQYIKDWVQASTIINWNPDTMDVVVANGTESISFNLQSGEWGSPQRFADAGVTGSALSSVASRNQLIMSVNNGGAHTAYTWNEGATTMPVTCMTNWCDRPSKGRTKTLNEIAAAFECDRIGDPLVISIHRNLRKTYVTDASTTSGVNTLTSATAKFTAEDSGGMCAIFGTNVGGAGVNYLVARMTYSSGTVVTLTHPTLGTTLNAGATLTNCYALVGQYVEAVAFTRTDQQHMRNLRPNVRECRSFAIGVNMVTSCVQGQVLDLVPFGIDTNVSQGKTA